MTKSILQRGRWTAALLAGFFGLVAVPVPIEAQEAAVPQGATVSGNTWCKTVISSSVANFQQLVTELVDSGGKVEGLNMTIERGVGGQMFAFVCGTVSGK